MVAPVQEGQASMARFDTQYGNLPFLFIGADMQQYASCAEIEYPNHRTAAGWLCRGLPASIAQRSVAQPQSPLVAAAQPAVTGLAIAGAAFAVALT